MDNKPLITYSGEAEVFQSVVSSLQKGIGTEAVEWKRAYGRTTKHVHLHPRFIPFDPELMCNQQGQNTAVETPLLTSLLDQPMLHTYWTDCSDVEVYRATIKDGIQSWLNAVKSCNVKEWLIILVEPADNKKSNKLLPRSSVLDKIKNDFAQKQTERTVCLSDPQKLDSKSAESLHSMLHRIRQLLLASYSKTLTKFEENMRAQREKRNEIGWNFCHYFLLQEELAFVLEMLEVYDEALVQYDELDALFTQFVLNSHLTDTPQWLLSFQRFGDRWPALTLSSANSAVVLQQIRESVRNSTVSLLNFRNYLFVRQAILLVKQRRINELAQRSLSFLHNCLNELAILDVAFSEDGCISCWVFVSCLEILGTICSSRQTQIFPITPPANSQETSNNNNKNLETSSVESGMVSLDSQNENSTSKDKDVEDTSPRIGTPKSNLKARNNSAHLHHLPQPNLMSATDFSVHTASLWDYAREKLYELGKLCGLLPKSQLKSDHLHKVITLAAGLSSFEEFTNGNKENENNIVTNQLPVPQQGETPIEKLKNALSSKDKFQQHYLELCELAMGTYKHIGRLRSARKVGLSLASYYMETEEFLKAIGFLTEALKTFKDDKWTILVMDVLLKLAQCYHAINDTDRYIRTCAQIACSKSLDEDKRNHFFDEMMNCLTEIETDDRFIMSPTEETFVIRSVKVESVGKINRAACEIIVNIDLYSNLPRPVLSSKVQMAILPCDHSPSVMGYSTSGAFMTTLGHLVSGGVGGGSSSSTSNNKPNNSTSNIKLSSHHNNQNKKRGDKIARHQTGMGTDAVVMSNIPNNNVKSDKSEISASKNKDRLTRKESTTPSLTCEDEDIALALLESNPAVLKLDFRQQIETKQQLDKQVQGGRLMCHDTHQSLRRKDSQVKGEIQVSKTDFSDAAKSTEIIINPGANKIQLFAKVSTAGTFRLSQVSIEVKHFELLSPRMGCRYRFCVEKEPSRIELQTSNLLAGIEQLIQIKLHTGSNYVDPQTMNLLVRSSMGLQLKLSENSPDLLSELSLPLPQTDSFSTCVVDLIVKAELGPQKDNSAIDHKLIAKCPWTGEERKLPVVFVPPFMSSHKLHSVGQRKFVQVAIQGLSDTLFRIYEHQLTVQHQNSADIPLVSLNPRSQSLTLHAGRNAAYIWEIGVLNWDDELPLRLEFSIQFKAEAHGTELYKYYICLQRFKTMFELKSKVEPHKGTEFCRVGNMCSMIIEISRFGNKPNGSDESQSSLMYEVRADQHMWAICGRSSGVVSIEEGLNSQEVSLDVMPMSPGYLPLPTVHLSKYIPADQKSGTSSVPKLEPFNAGQVYNRCKGSQVHVLPPPQSTTGSSSAGLSGGGSSGGASLPIIIDTHF